MGITNKLSLGSCLQVSGSNSILYKVIGNLGKGFYGSTFLGAVQLRTSLGIILDTDYKVVVKMIDVPISSGHNKPQVNGNDNELVSIVNKYLRLSELRHPNVVRFYDVSYNPADNTAFCVMEYVNAITLDEYIAKNKELSEEEAIRITKQIANALSYLHSKGILHLDLKPSNIMIKGSGDIVIIDFSLSKIDSYHNKNEIITSYSVGTPGYAPLEQIHCSHAENYSVTMDVYALGATMYKMLTGVRPPEAIDILSDGFPLYVLWKHHVSDAVSKSIAIAMAPDKDRRYGSVKRFIQSLDEEKPYFDIKIATEERKQTPILDGHFIVPKNVQRVTVEYRTGRMNRGYYGVMDRETVRIATSRDPDATCMFFNKINEQFNMFLHDLRSLNLRTRREITVEFETYSEEPPMFSLTLYDESNETIYKYWISGWNNEHGNIDGNIYEVENNVRGIFPFLQDIPQ